MHDEMTRLALVIIGDVLFGLDLWTDVPEMSGAAQTALAVLKQRVAALVPLPLWIPTADNRRFNRAMRVLHRYIDDILDRTRDAGDQAPGFLKMLIEARDPDGGSPMTGRQLHEEMLGMLQQGHDTVGEALAWVWYLLSLHPEVERRLHDEVCRTIGNRVPVAADLPELTYAHMVLQEAMRLYPPVWVIPRDAIERGPHRLVPAFLPARRSCSARTSRIGIPMSGTTPRRSTRPRSSRRGARSGRATPTSRSAAVRACAWARTWRRWRCC